MKDQILIEIAKKAIAEELTGEKLIDREALLREYPELSGAAALFVTINEHSSLRGCIGSLIAHRSLLDDLVHNAKAAAFSDPRFLPLGKDELDDIEIEISLLSSPEELNYTDRRELERVIRPRVDGVILELGGRQATYLPSVWEQLPEFGLFFSSLCQKAGLPSNCVDMHPRIYRYQARKIKEKR